MNSNLRLVLAISALFGIATGVYEFVLPYYLQSQQVTFPEMGAIFALSGLAMVLARIYMGGLADRWGRKGLYGWAVGLCGLASGLSAIPPLAQLGGQFLLKTIRDTAAMTRETIYPILLYEEGEAGFLNLIGKFRGIEYLLQAGGTMVAGTIINRLGAGAGGYRLALYVSGTLLALGSVYWALGFREHWRPTTQHITTLHELFNFDLHPNLQILVISGIIFTFGNQLSHSFYLPLFFHARYGVAPAVVAVVMVLHRFTIALPLLVVGNLRLKNLRAWYIWGLLLEGLTMSGSAVFPKTMFLPAAGIYLLHDLIGAGVWLPIQATLIQRYSREENRGLEVGKVLAWSSIGSILGPLMAGVLATRSPVYPFLASGIVMALSAIPLCWLKLHAPSPAAPVSLATV